MKLPQKRKLNKKVVIIAAIAAVVACAGLVFAFTALNRSQTPQSDEPAPTNTVDYNPPTEEEKSEAATQEPTDPGTPTKANPNPEPAQPTSSITITISRASQTAPNEPLNIRTFVPQTLSGTCTFTLTKQGSATVTRTFNIEPSPRASTCNGDIAASEFGTAGEWTLTAVANSDGKTSQAATQKVTIQK